MIQNRKSWSEYPIGTKAKAISGGFWIKVNNGWRWCSGSIFPTPGADASGEVILPTEELSWWCSLEEKERIECIKKMGEPSKTFNTLTGLMNEEIKQHYQEYLKNKINDN